jgi:hypothetical protein
MMPRVNQIREAQSTGKVSSKRTTLLRQAAEVMVSSRLQALVIEYHAAALEQRPFPIGLNFLCDCCQQQLDLISCVWLSTALGLISCRRSLRLIRPVSMHKYAVEGE